MTLEQAVLWVHTTANSGVYGKKTVWGVYTINQTDALALTISIIPASPELHVLIPPNYYPHYHVFGRDIFKQYKNFHAWFGVNYK